MRLILSFLFLCFATAVAAQDRTPSHCIALTEAPCPADIDGSGAVDAADLAALLAAWNTGDVDLDMDGDTGPGDLAILLAAWGDCPK